MSNWTTAYNWMLDNEDAEREYKVVPDAPPGAFAISGINSAAFPDEFDAIAKLMISERGPGHRGVLSLALLGPQLRCPGQRRTGEAHL